jgi:hypothetical protein
MMHNVYSIRAAGRLSLVSQQTGFEAYSRSN